MACGYRLGALGAQPTEPDLLGSPGLGDPFVRFSFVSHDDDPGPFDRDGATRLAVVPDDALAALDVRAGDRVIVIHGRAAEYGDLALVEEDGAEAFWKVYPEGDDLHLSTGDARRTVAAASVRVLGVGVAVLRRLRV